MRKTIGLLATVSLIGGLAATQSAVAQGGCGAVTFASSVTSQFPEASNACLDIATREGKQYAHFKGEIVSVSGSQVRARFKLPNGQYSQTYAFTPKSSSRIKIAGQTYRFSELQKGQELDLYVPPDRWEFEVPETESFAAAPTVETYRVTTVTVGALPHTASEVPLVGLLSVVLFDAGYRSSQARVFRKDLLDRVDSKVDAVEHDVEVHLVEAQHAALRVEIVSSHVDRHHVRLLLAILAAARELEAAVLAAARREPLIEENGLDRCERDRPAMHVPHRARQRIAVARRAHDPTFDRAGARVVSHRDRDIQREEHHRGDHCADDGEY
jgi:hypothetical protein